MAKSIAEKATSIRSRGKGYGSNGLIFDIHPRLTIIHTKMKTRFASKNKVLPKNLVKSFTGASAHRRGNSTYDRRWVLKKLSFLFIRAVSPEQNPNFFPTKSRCGNLKQCGRGGAKQFVWGNGFAPPRLLSRPQEGSGEECGRVSESFCFLLMNFGLKIPTAKSHSCIIHQH